MSDYRLLYMYVKNTDESFLLCKAGRKRITMLNNR